MSLFRNAGDKAKAAMFKSSGSAEGNEPDDAKFTVEAGPGDYEPVRRLHNTSV